MQRLTAVGFDGLHIDWEYPGAPDRGGKPEDTHDFVKLLETMRKTFDGSGNKFGLNFADEIGLGGGLIGASDHGERRSSIYNPDVISRPC